MTTNEKQTISVATKIKSPAKEVWRLWTEPKHIIHWNYAAEEWHCPYAENNLVIGGKFVWRMEARDGSMGFDFSGEYRKIDDLKFIETLLDDGRKVSIEFVSEKDETTVTETFEAEDINPLEMQKTGWQMILNNFRKYAENSTK